MRQVLGFLKVIGRADLVEFYTQLLSYGTIHGAKLCSLDEFLALTSGKDQDAPKVFDEDTDRILEERALKRLHERRPVNG
jgi:hypothetical protein